jgi:hypothetical protein
MKEGRMLNFKHPLVIVAIVFVLGFSFIGWRYTEGITEKNDIEREKLRLMASSEEKTKFAQQQNETVVTEKPTKNEEDVKELKNILSEQDLAILNKKLDENCLAASYKEFQRSSLVGYGWRSNWNTNLKTCFMEQSGWDSELAGNWSQTLYDPINDVGYGSLVIYNSAVANGTQLKTENPAINGVIKICLKGIFNKNQSTCSSLDEWFKYEKSLMENK